MKQVCAAFLAGIVFALGIGIGGMTKPAKVIGFLDFTGNWDPSLAFVMISAIGFYALACRVSRRWSKPLLAPDFSLPVKKEIDFRLITGAGIFGVGWGLAGFCPAPGLTAIASGQLEPAVFSLAMIAGMAAHKISESFFAPQSYGNTLVDDM